MVENLSVTGYVLIVVSNPLGGRGETQSYDFTCPPKPRRQLNLSVAESESKMEVDTNCEEI